MAPCANDQPRGLLWTTICSGPRPAFGWPSLVRSSVRSSMIGFSWPFCAKPFGVMPFWVELIFLVRTTLFLSPYDIFHSSYEPSIARDHCSCRKIAEVKKRFLSSTKAYPEGPSLADARTKPASRSKTPHCLDARKPPGREWVEPWPNMERVQPDLNLPKPFQRAKLKETPMNTST